LERTATVGELAMRERSRRLERIPALATLSASADVCR
jgi:hypothetical protein